MQISANGLAILFIKVKGFISGTTRLRIRTMKRLLKKESRGQFIMGYSEMRPLEQYRQWTCLKLREPLLTKSSSNGRQSERHFMISIKKNQEISRKRN
jgi:hypothetical protein